MKWNLPTYLTNQQCNKVISRNFSKKSHFLFFLKNAQQHGKLEITEFTLIVKCTLYCAKTRILILLEYFVKSNLAINQSVSRNFKYIVRVTFCVSAILQSFAKYFVKSISHSFFLNKINFTGKCESKLNDFHWQI